MPDRLSSEEIDETLRRAAAAGRYNSLRTIISVATLAIITVLFLVWVVFGQATIGHQNQQILTGVQTELQHLEDHLDDSIRQSSIGDRVIVCILNVDPLKRTDQTTNRCLTAAEHGQDHLPVDHHHHHHHHRPSQTSTTGSETSPGSSEPSPTSSPCCSTSTATATASPKPCEKVGHGAGRHCKGHGNH